MELTMSAWNGTFEEWEDTRPATDAEVLAYVATLDGAVSLRLCLQHMDTDDGTSMECRMVEGVFLSDKETTDD